VKSTPSLVVIGGPNGSGKSTTAPALLRDTLAVSEFVNADQIATGLSGFNPDSAAFAAGRALLRRLHELAKRRVDFAFESTLASRSFAPFIAAAKSEGYRVHLVYLWLSSPGLAIARVARRVREGGHSVPKEIVTRRYGRGLANFFRLYQPLADTWRFYDNSGEFAPRLIATGVRRRASKVHDRKLWASIRMAVDEA
jgi:predicted ABC-type ATPase